MLLIFGILVILLTLGAQVGLFVKLGGILIGIGIVWAYAQEHKDKNRPKSS